MSTAHTPVVVGSPDSDSIWHAAGHKPGVVVRMRNVGRTVVEIPVRVGTAVEVVEVPNSFGNHGHQFVTIQGGWIHRDRWASIHQAVDTALATAGWGFR